jgi:hypothetical protein
MAASRWCGNWLSRGTASGPCWDTTSLPATSLAPYSTHRYRIPFDATGKKWVRFAAWDSAGNGAFTEPVHLP